MIFRIVNLTLSLCWRILFYASSAPTFACEALDRQTQLVAIDLQRAVEPPDNAFRECASGSLPCGFAMRCKPDASAEWGGQEQGCKFARVDSKHG